MRSRSKYRNVPIEYDGITFDSKGEMRRYQELKLLEKAGKISDLQTHVPISLRAHGCDNPIGKYESDFSYAEWRIDGTCKVVLEDFKGHDTALSRWKRKHVLRQYGIEVRVVKAGKR